MFTPENKIIIVDDNPKDLETLSKPFYEKGIGCKCFEYDVNYNSPLLNVRIAFFDIYLKPSGSGSDSQIFNDIAIALMQYISVNNGPYALIFWTSHKDKIERIKKFIQERYKNCPKPFLVDLIDKDVFLNNPENLISRLNEVLSDKTLEILFEFESISSQSAASTINQLYNIIPTDDTWGETEVFKQNFEKVFSKIAIQSLGYKHAKENPDKGVISTLLPILNHHIENTYKSDKWKNYLSTLATSSSNNDISFPDYFREDKLNNIFHIHIPDTIRKIERGVVIKINSDESFFLSNFGIKYSDWFSKLLPGITRQKRESSELIAVEISASCDYSQNKPRLNKYMLGVFLPEDAVEEINNDKKPQNLMLVDGIFSNESKFKICLNLNYVFSAFPDDPKLDTPLFVLKKEIMDQIGNRYANHISRIGITTF